MPIQAIRKKKKSAKRTKGPMEWSGDRLCPLHARVLEFLAKQGQADAQPGLSLGRQPMNF